MYLNLIPITILVPVGISKTQSFLSVVLFACWCYKVSLEQLIWLSLQSAWACLPYSSKRFHISPSIQFQRPIHYSNESTPQKTVLLLYYLSHGCDQSLYKKQLREERLALVGSLRGDSTSEWGKQGGQGCLCQGGRIWWCIFLTSPLSGSRGIIQDWAITSRLHPSDLVLPTSPYVLKALYLPPNTPAHGKQVSKHRSIWWTCHFQTITPINGWLMGSCFQACNLMSDERWFGVSG